MKPLGSTVSALNHKHPGSPNVASLHMLMMQAPCHPDGGIHFSALQRVQWCQDQALGSERPRFKSQLCLLKGRVREFPGSQWVGLCAFTAGAKGSTPGCRIKILRAQGHGQKNLRNKGCVSQNKCHFLFGASFFHQ